MIIEPWNHERDTLDAHIKSKALIWASTRENLSSGVCEQQRRRPACASAQSDQRLCCSVFGKYHFKACYKRNFNFLASPCSWADWFESHFVGNPEDRFCRDEAQLMYIKQLSLSLSLSLCDMIETKKYITIPGPSTPCTLGAIPDRPWTNNTIMVALKPTATTDTGASQIIS